MTWASGRGDQLKGRFSLVSTSGRLLEVYGGVEVISADELLVFLISRLPGLGDFLFSFFRFWVTQRGFRRRLAAGESGWPTPNLV